MTPNYQHQHSRQTLAEAIEEYHAAYEQELTTRKLSPEGEAFFRSHDVVHVVFGCDISLDDEVVVKISSFLGTSGEGVFKGYRLPESKEIYQTISLSVVLVMICKSLVLVPRTVWRCLCMHRRWPWSDFDRYLDTPLNDIRAKFGVRVAH